MKIEPTVAAIAIADAEKAHPSWSVAASRAPKIHRDHGQDLAWLGARPGRPHGARPDHPADPRARSRPIRAVALRQRARSRTSSVVRSFRKVRTVQQAQRQQRHPGPQPVGGQQVKEVAREVMTRVIGRPLSRSPSPTPSSSGISRCRASCTTSTVRASAGRPLLPFELHRHAPHHQGEQQRISRAR